MRHLLLLTWLAAGPLGAQPLRVVLLQQASGDGHRKTLYALQEAGFQVTWINKDTAARLPVTSDGWRAAYDLVCFGTLALEGGLDKVLSAQQLAAMIGFVRAGGGLVTVIGEAGKSLAEVLPVTAGGGAGPMEFRPEVAAPEHPALRGLPAQWPVLGSRWNSFAKVAAKPEATVLLTVPEHYAGTAYPFLVAGSYGAGRVICFNSLWSYSTGMRFANWEWAPAVFGQLGRWAAGREPLPADQVKPIADPTWFWRYEIETIPDAAKHQQQPVVYDAGPPLTEPVALALAPTPPAEIVPVTAAARLTDTAQAVEIAFGNGLVAVLDKRGMVAYRTADGLVLAREPTAQTPRILFSGAVTPEKVKTEGGEAFVLQEPIPAASAGAQTFSFRRCQADGPAAVATFGVRVGADEVASLTWRFAPRTQLVDGVRWQGVGESFVIDSPRLFVEYLEPSHRWAIGGQVAGHHTFRTGCYSQPRGYHEVHFDDATSQDAGHLRLFSSGQPFQMLGSPRGTLWSWPERPMLVASWLANTAGKGHVELVTKIGLGRRRGRVEVPPMWYLFTPEPLTHNLWLSGYDHLRAKVRADYGLQHQVPKPTGMMRFSIMGFVDLKRYADALIPLAARLGFRRIDAGVTYVHDRMDPHNGGLEALKYLCDKAKAAGIEVGLYAGSAWSKDDFEPLKAHPEWLVHDRAGKVQDTGYEHIQTVSLRSGWRDLTLQRYRELSEQTGVGAVWLDSWTMPNEYLDYADPDARPTVEEAIRYVKAIQDLGYTTWVEGQSPAAIDSFWHRRDRYTDFTGHEFVLANTSPFAYAGNGLFHLDLFRLTSYHAAMFQDPRLLTDPAAPLTQAAVAANGLMNQAHDTLGTPLHVRETPFGTVWECPTGYALFAHRTASVAIDLPAGAWDLIPAYGEPKLALKGTKLTGQMPARSAVLVRRR